MSPPKPHVFPGGTFESDWLMGVPSQDHPTDWFSIVLSDRIAKGGSPTLGLVGTSQ